MTYKYVVRNVARAAGKSVDLHAEADLRRQRLGHAHASVALERRHAALRRQVRLRGPLAARPRYVGGLLMHAPALLAFCAPTTNSYRRLVPGYEAPVNLVYSQRNRSAAIRIPMYSDSAKAKRLEFRCPDATANPYLAFSAMLMAGLDGIEKGLDPGDPADFDLFEEARGDIAQVPGSLGRRSTRSRRPGVPARGRRLQRGPASAPGSTTSGRTRSTSSLCDPTRPSSRSTTTPESRRGLGSGSPPLAP